jgi:hypothetical protein
MALSFSSDKQYYQSLYTSAAKNSAELLAQLRL